MERIVVGFDGSDDARRALERAVEIAKDTGARLSIVSSAKLSRLMRDPGGGASPVDPADAEQRAAALDEARKYMADQGMAADFVEGHGAAGDVLIEEAQAQNADLIVIGTRGHGATRRALLGSTSTHVAHHAPCDVLIVR
jgi:nucleotide-binding universal stress UspA family protein